MESRSNRGYNPNPDNMPKFIDYCFLIRDNVLDLTQVYIDIRDEDKHRNLIESKPNFVRWITVEDKEFCNKCIREWLIDYYKKI